MKIPDGKDIRNWDQYTIEHEPIASIDLMERAASACVKWLKENCRAAGQFHIFCGKGNNGGDGLAIARMLAVDGIPVFVHILEFGHLGTPDFQANLARLHQHPSVDIKYIQSAEHFPSIPKESIVIDALLGSGLNRPLDAVTAALVKFLNENLCLRIAIDIPSGMYTDRSSKGNTMIAANHTLAFQCYKPAFLVAENGPFMGQVHILDIGLHQDFYEAITPAFELVDEDTISNIFKPRNPFAHKGMHGHVLLLTGSYGKMGAAQLCARACLRAGAGLVTCHIPSSGYDILQSTVPEAMVSTDFNSSFLTKFEGEASQFAAIGMGPGIGTASETRRMVKNLLQSDGQPLVIDADALNIIALDGLASSIPPGSILTPHPKEFQRLFGESRNDFEMIALAKEKAEEHKLIIVLKGHHTLVAAPGATLSFNATGNAGLAKGGSGDVLTGILAALLAQGYAPRNAAILGVYLHGLAGDFAAAKLSMEAMLAGDVIDQIPAAFSQLTSQQVN